MGSKYYELENAARRLLDAIDRMHGAQLLSFNVREASADLRTLIPRQRDPLDRSSGSAQV